MNANFILSETSTCNFNNNQQQSISIQSYHNQMQSLPPHSEAENNFFFQHNQINASQGQAPNGNLSNDFLQENDVTIQRKQQQMAVSSPSVSSTADLNSGLGNGQNGMRYGGFCGGSQQLDSSNFVLQQSTVEDGIRNGDFCVTPQQNALRQSLQFSTINGHLLNGQNGGICFPPNFPFSTMVPSTNAFQRRTFLFNSDMANCAIKSVQQNLIEDMAGWHLKHYAVVPSTSRVAFEPKRAVNNNNCTNGPASRATNTRGIKRKASAAQSVSEIQQPHSMSLSPREIRPPSYTSSVGHPQSAPLLSNQFDHLQHSNELCDSSTNSDLELFKGSSGHMQPNGTMSNYLQNGSAGQMDENPLKKMEIMTSKTLNEPTNGRNHRLYMEDASEQNQQAILCAADASKQEKMHKLQEIEKALLPFADTSPTYPNAGPFPDSTQFRPHFFASPSQMMMQTPQTHLCAIRPLMGSFPQNHSHKMAVINPNQQLHNTIGEHSAVVMQADGIAIDENTAAQQSWLQQ